jgi:hypothetical protein
MPGSARTRPTPDTSASMSVPVPYNVEPNHGVGVSSLPAWGSTTDKVLGRLLNPASDSYRSIGEAVPQIQIGPQGARSTVWAPWLWASSGALSPAGP